MSMEFDSFSRTNHLASPLITKELILTLEHATHINRKHCNPILKNDKSQFKPAFNLTATLAYLTRLTFEDSPLYWVDKEGYNYKHGRFYRCIFNIKKVIGWSPTGQPCKKLAIFHLWSQEMGIVSKSLVRTPYFDQKKKT